MSHPQRALLDANVLFGAGLRDALLRLANARLFQPLWSAAIHDEWMRSVSAKRPDVPFHRLERARDEMNKEFPEAAVTGYGSLVSGIDLPDPGDRHVLAAAIHGRANVIVTSNLRHFPDGALEPCGIAARRPDDFAAALFESSPGAAVAAARSHRAALKNPPRSPAEHLEALERAGLDKFSSLLRRRIYEI